MPIDAQGEEVCNCGYPVCEWCAYQRGVKAERERCAKECEMVAQNWSANNDEYKSIALMCAEQIRTGKH